MGIFLPKASALARADINAVNPDGTAALMLAVEPGYEDLVKALVNSKYEQGSECEKR